MIKAIFFDLDGVLVDTLDWHFQAFQSSLKLFGYSVSEADHQRYYNGLPTSQKLRILSERRGFPKRLHTFAAEMKQIYTKKVIEQTCRPNPELQKLLGELKNRGFRLAVASNSIKKTVTSILDKSGITPYFDVVLSAEEVTKPKPSPVIYREVMTRMGLLPEECLILEDSAPGIEAAEAACPNILRIRDVKDVSLDRILNRIADLRSDAETQTMEILIPMAGLGTRFQAAGYVKPKPFIDVFERPMIQWVIENVSPTTGSPHFTFICNETQLRDNGIEKDLKKLSPRASIVTVPATTEGAACTALLAMDTVNPEAPLLMANSDQWVDTSIDQFLSKTKDCDGLIMTFPASDKKWSYAKVNAKGLVTEVAEKNPISPHATVGIYYFRKAKFFFEAAQAMIRKNVRVNNEFYVCPVYNELIQQGKRIEIFEIPEAAMYGLGTPEDLQSFLSKNPRQKAA